MSGYGTWYFFRANETIMLLYISIKMLKKAVKTTYPYSFGRTSVIFTAILIALPPLEEGRAEPCHENKNESVFCH